MAGWRKNGKNNAMGVIQPPQGGSGHFLGSFESAPNNLRAAEIISVTYPVKTCGHITGPCHWL